MSAMSAPTVFLSAATIDLEPLRNLLARAFRAAQFRVLVQDDSLGAPIGRVRDLLASAIDQCDCVIHLAGQGYGSHATDPFIEHPGFRCSWTQFEYYYPHQLPTPIPVIGFVCGPALSVMARPEEGNEDDVALKVTLQQAHCARVANGKFTGTPWDDPKFRTVNDKTAETVEDLVTRVAAAVGTLQRNHDACKRVQQELLSLVEQINQIEKGVGSANEKLDRVLALLLASPTPVAVGPNLHQIPPVKAGFTGRETDLAALRHLEPQGGTAVITGLGGMGGIGKSELAKVLAHEWRPRFPDAQIWLDGYGTRTDPPPPSAGDLIAQVIRAFHPEAGQLPEDLASLQALYRQTLEGKKALIVLDNAAHPEVADQAGQLVPPEGCGLIVTSRRSFLVGGKAPYTVGRLPEPEAIELLREVCPELGEADAADVAARCGGLPLALRLAGTHLALDGASPTSVATYLEVLANGRLAALDADAADAGEVTIAETLRLSVDSLPAGECAAWLRLGVFAGDFDADAARAVAGEAADSAFLNRLVRRNLLERETSSGDRERYRLHDLAAEYARGRLNTEEGADVLDAASLAHAEHYAAVGKTADQLYLAGKPLAGLALFDRERVQIEAGFAWLTTHPDGGAADRALLVLVDGVSYSADLRFHPRQMIAWMEAQAASARRVGHREAEGAALGNLGLAHNELGDASRAIQYHEECLVLHREIGDRGGEGSALGNLGIAHGRLDEPRRAIWYFEQQLEIAREIGDTRGEGNALGNMASALRQLGETRRAIGYFEQALEIARKIGDRRAEGTFLGNLGTAHHQLGDTSRAIGYYDEALEIAREVGDRSSEGNALARLALVQDGLGERAEALARAEAALAIFETIEHPNADNMRTQIAEWRAELFFGGGSPQGAGPPPAL
jgi:tetratricopeptide (TPR) repeat protein